MSPVNDALFVVLAALAVYRLSLLLAVDVGPYECFASLRAELGRGAARATKGKYALIYQVSEWIHCPYCSSLWFSALIVAFYTHKPLRWLLLTLATAGLQAFLQNHTTER